MEASDTGGREREREAEEVQYKAVGVSNLLVALWETDVLLEL